MDTIDPAHLTYLVLLGTALAFYFVVSNRQSWGKNIQQAAIWGLIFLGVIAAYGLWSDIQRTTMPRQTVFATEGRVEVPQAIDGHYYLTLTINGAPVEFVVDTGATDMVLTKADAARVGLDPDSLRYFGSAMTANGQVDIALVRLDEVVLGDIRDTGVPATVNAGEMPGSLLGMRYLDRFNRVSFGNGQLVLER